MRYGELLPGDPPREIIHSFSVEKREEFFIGNLKLEIAAINHYCGLDENSG